MNDEKPMGQGIQIDEARIRDHLGEMVRGTVEETLNAMLDAEADQLCGAGRYERSQARQDTRAGSYERTLQTSAGEVNLKVPKLRRQTFETAIIERYRRRESSVEEALIEMYQSGSTNPSDSSSLIGSSFILGRSRQSRKSERFGTLSGEPERAKTSPAGWRSCATC